MTKQPTAAQRRRMSRVAELGCIIRSCQMPAIIHHCGTGAGGRRNHDLILPICPVHHQGHGEGISLHDNRKAWYLRYGSEEYLMKIVDFMLEDTQITQ